MEERSTFRRFDIVSDDSDHYFLQSNNGRNKVVRDCFSNPKSKVYKSIMREWKTLDQNLPESIYVQVYERHINLMRAVIVGVAGTPYHDGLFFFNIAFPSDYPNQPPMLHFLSFGLRLNPNLYENGKVCLSLLNTWKGNKNQMWDPSRSTLLQVLLSIQALVLNEEPFYNEPLFNEHRYCILRRSNFERQSHAYNEEVFIYTCKISIFLIRRPPKNFEAFVTGHFRERAFAILMACNEYVNGRVRIGYYNCNDGSSRSFWSTEKVSKDFKESIERFYPVMFQEFLKCGASLGTSIERLELSAERSNIFKKVMAKIERALGWEKI